MEKRILFLLLAILLSVMFPLFAEGGNLLSQQYALSLSYTTSEIAPVTGFMKTALSLDGNDYTAGFRADQMGADIALSTRIRFGADHGRAASLSDTIIAERRRRSFFTDIAVEMNFYPGLGNTYAAALSLGQEFIFGKGFYKAGLAYELGIYAHVTTFNDFQGTAHTFNPLYSIAFTSSFNDCFFINLSFITRVPFYYPKQTANGLRITAAMLISKMFSLGYDGYLLFSDYIGETEFIHRAEHTIFFTWSFGL